MQLVGVQVPGRGFAHPHSRICQRALLQSRPREQLHESPCPQPAWGNSPAAKPAPGASPQQGHQETSPAPLFTARSGGRKVRLQFRSNFEDARRDVTTKRACSGTVPTRTHDARSSPAFNASLPIPPVQQTSGFTDVTTTACTSQARTHTHTHTQQAEQLAMLWLSQKRSWIPSQRAALPLWPLPSPCSIPGGPQVGRCPQHPALSAALRDAQPGQPCSRTAGVTLGAHHASVQCRPVSEMPAGTTGKAWLSRWWRWVFGEQLHPGKKPGRCWETAATERSACSRPGLGLQGKEPCVYMRQLHFPHCNKLLPTLLPHQTAANVRVL